MMIVRYKHKSRLYRDITAAALLLAIIILTAQWFENTIYAFIEGAIGLFAILYRFLELGIKNEKEVLSITGKGISNRWGAYSWEQIRDMHIEKNRYLLYTIIEKNQSEKAFRYDLEELEIDRNELNKLIEHHKTIGQ